MYFFPIDFLPSYLSFHLIVFPFYILFFLLLFSFNFPFSLLLFFSFSFFPPGFFLSHISRKYLHILTNTKSSRCFMNQYYHLLCSQTLQVDVRPWLEASQISRRLLFKYAQILKQEAFCKFFFVNYIFAPSTFLA